MIQGVINRQASNSFQAKSWAIALLAGLVGLSRASKQDILVAGLGIVILFWLLDSYYLSRERKFRALFDKVRKVKVTDFSMDISNLKDFNHSWIACCFRVVEVLPYGAMAIGIILFTVIK